MLDAITDILADALILVPLFILLVVVIGLIYWAVDFFFPEPQRDLNEVVKTHPGS